MEYQVHLRLSGEAPLQLSHAHRVLYRLEWQQQRLLLTHDKRGNERLFLPLNGYPGRFGLIRLHSRYQVSLIPCF